MATTASCAVVLEVLPVRLVDGVECLLTGQGHSLRLDWPSGAPPNTAVVGFTRDLGLTPLVCHSTSWRACRRALLVTYLVAIEGAAPRGCVFRPIRPSEIARGSALDAPDVIDELDVIRHALAHLAWLMHSDCVVRETLASWEAALQPFRPEPFREFGLASSGEPSAAPASRAVRSTAV